MIAYGTISRGQRVTVVRGTGYSFTIHDRTGAGETKTPQASGAENKTALNCYIEHNAAYNAVNKKIDIRV